MEQKIFRIWMDISRKGFSHYEFYADIVETHYMKVLSAARQGRVGNWKFHGYWGRPRKSCRKIEYVGMIDLEDAEDPREPLEHILQNWKSTDLSEASKGNYRKISLPEDDKNARIRINWS